MKTLLRGGYVVSPRGYRRADVLIDGEKIRQVGHISPAEGSDARTVDVSGQYLFPGFIDAHTHFDLDVCGTTTADDFASGTMSAIRGGTTSIIDFACPNKGESLAHGLSLWHEKADGRCFCDYGFHMTVDDWNPSVAAELDSMFDAGITSFKVYLTYPAMMIGDEAVYSVLKALKKRGGIVGVHCENAGIIDGRIRELKAAGRGGEVSSHPIAREDFCEAEAVSRVLRIAQAADCPVVIVHTTCAAALEEIERARQRGQTVYVETCPQYLALDGSVYSQTGFSAAARFVCAPPIRGRDDREALWRALRRGNIQTVSTDHCSFTAEQKNAGAGDFTKIPGGLPGVETRAEVIYTLGVAGRRISLGTMCSVMCENPARLYGLFPRKGIIAVGSDADIVVYDPKADHILCAADMVSRAGYTPYEGMRTSGSITAVYLRGQPAVRHGKVIVAQAGQYLERGIGSL